MPDPKITTRGFLNWKVACLFAVVIIAAILVGHAFHLGFWQLP